MISDPPYGIELDTEWRDRAGLNDCAPAICPFTAFVDLKRPDDNASSRFERRGEAEAKMELPNRIRHPIEAPLSRRVRKQFAASRLFPSAQKWEASPYASRSR
jgi:hypothetical protein